MSDLCGICYRTQEAAGLQKHPAGYVDLRLDYTIQSHSAL